MTLLAFSDSPSAPINLRVTDVTDESIFISWMPPLYDGGAAITGYLVETCHSGESNWCKSFQTDANTLEAEISGLKKGEFYFVHIHAINERGNSIKACDFFEPICCQKATSEF